MLLIFKIHNVNSLATGHRFI